MVPAGKTAYSRVRIIQGGFNNRTIKVIITRENSTLGLERALLSWRNKGNKNFPNPGAAERLL